jgi:hypothetical protein
MISFQKFLNLKEALSLDDPLAQSILKIKDKYPNIIKFESKLDNNIYEIIINTQPTTIEIDDEDYSQTELDTLNLMGITLKSNGLYSLTNQSGMKANIVYNMLLNAIKQAHNHFGENNVHGYEFSGSNYKQDLMYDKLMKRFAPNLITWSYGIYLKPETIQKLKDDNPQMINKINEKIHFSTLDRQRLLQQRKEDKNQQRKERITP